MAHSAEQPDWALKLLHKPGRKITIIEMMSKLAANVSRSSRWSLMKTLKLMGVEMRTRTRLLEVTDEGVKVMTDQGEEFIPADTVIMAAGVLPVNDLEKALKGSSIEIVTLGDANKPGKIGDAVRQGFEAALQSIKLNGSRRQAFERSAN